MIIDDSRSLTRMYRKFLRLKNPISTSVDANAFYCWGRDQPKAQEHNINNQFFDPHLVFLDDSNDARTNETNSADRNNKNVKEENFINPTVPIKNYLLQIEYV